MRAYLPHMALLLEDEEQVTKTIKGMMNTFIDPINGTFRRSGRICLVILSAPFLVIKMMITDAKEEASDIEQASKS